MFGVISDTLRLIGTLQAIQSTIRWGYLADLAFCMNIKHLSNGLLQGPALKSLLQRYSQLTVFKSTECLSALNQFIKKYETMLRELTNCIVKPQERSNVAESIENFLSQSTLSAVGIVKEANQFQSSFIKSRHSIRKK